MPTMKTITEHRYGSKQRFPGDEYEATDRDAKLLKAVGRSEVAAAAKSPSDLPKEVMQRAAPAPPVEDEAEADSAPLPKAGFYQTRDLRAEDGRTGEDGYAPLSRRGRLPKPTT